MSKRAESEVLLKTLRSIAVNQAGRKRGIFLAKKELKLSSQGHTDSILILM